MKNLNEIIYKLNPIKVLGNSNIEYLNIHSDSRKIDSKDLFVAIIGLSVDGHDFIEQALINGAIVLVCSTWPNDDLINKSEVTVILVKDTSVALGIIASNFYDLPSHFTNLIGITGTNGKTTTATLLYDLFTALGYKSGLISTIVNKIGNLNVPASHTTPDALNLQMLLADMVDSGCEYVFMEVSSHAIHQNRIEGCKFKMGIFTNISHDHLDYHKTFANYIKAKKMFFDNLDLDAIALINHDDKRGAVMLQNTKAKKATYALKRQADFKAKVLENNLNGLHMDLDGHEFFARLIGAFNAYNLLAAYSVAKLLNQDTWQVLTELSNLRPAPGRFEYVVGQRNRIIGIVDYAHTPDALHQVLITIQSLNLQNGNIICVIGAGGDRDKAKRSQMAKIAADHSNKVILTSDNPRTEDPTSIIEDMYKGIPIYAIRNTLRIVDREEAIKTAVLLSQANDIILVAGKGHEAYQEINNHRLPFDDKHILQKLLSN